MRLSGFVMAALFAVMAASALSAQTWDETTNGGGDAGELPASGQEVSGTGALSTITGNLPAQTDRDMYRIRIANSAAFSATTVGGTGTNDTVLMLFTDAGVGIALNDDEPSPGTSFLSTLPAGNALYNTLPAGNYWIAVSRYQNYPDDATAAIWDDNMGSLRGVYAPLSTGAIAGWTNYGSFGTDGAYTVTLTGAEFVSAVPAPEMDVLNGGTSIADGGTDALGNIGITATQSVTYTIENNGNLDLTLTGATPVVVTAGTNVQGVSVVAQPATTIGQSSSVQFTVNYTVQAAGPFDFTVSIDNDDSDENPYNWTVDGTGVAAPEINVTRGGSIVSGGTDAVGNRTFNQNSNLTYTVQNLGTAALNITSIVISGEVNVTATVTSGLTSVAAASNDTFTVQINPTAQGAFSFTITINNDDADEGAYVINVTGTGTKKKKSGGGGDDGGCSTNGGSSAWLALIGLLGAVALATRLRASRE